jgi:hypothetical protein
LSVSTSLVGVGRAAPPPTNPTPGSLVINPTAADFGSSIIGTALPPRNFTVSNPGQTAVPLTGVTLSGGGADQFTIISNSCSGALNAGATCTITVRSTPTRVAASSAQLRVTGSGGQSAQATLRVRGLPAPPPPEQTFNPELRMNPGVIHSGEVTTAVGSAFPPDIDVQLAFAGEAPFATVHTDATGAFRFDLLILPNDPRIGGFEVIAIDQPLFSGVRAPLLIDLATYQPAGVDNPALTGSGVLKLVTRGG